MRVDAIPLLSLGAAIVVLAFVLRPLLSRAPGARASDATPPADESDEEPPWPPDPVPIATIVDGAAVRVSGRVRAPAEPLRAPLTKRPCVYYAVTIDEASGQGRGARRRARWKNRDREENHRDFVVVDASGEARARVRRDHTTFVQVPTDHEAPQGRARDAYVRRRGLEVGALPGAAGNVSVGEAIVSGDDVVEVCGHARRDGKSGALVIDAELVVFVRASEGRDA